MTELIKCIKYIVFFLLLPAYNYGQPKLAVNLTKVEDSVWIHTSYKLINNSNVPSNCLVIQTSAGIILIDTPWNDSLTVELVGTLKEQFNNNISLAIITHAHEDRIGGIKELHKKGIKVIAYEATCKKAVMSGYETPVQFLSADTVFAIGKEKIELFFPGSGHTSDNIVVWIPQRKILFGGCFVKAVASELGNIAEADLKSWPESIHTVIEKFPDVKIVIPGHGTWGGFNLLKHTAELLKQK